MFARWLRGGRRPAPAALHTQLLARAQVAPGADGLAVVDTLLAEVMPFAQCALEAGFNAQARAQPVAHAVGGRLLQGALDGVRPHAGREGVLRVALRPDGRHGGQALRHGLDWLLASLHGLPLYEVYSEKKGEEPRLCVREPLSPDAASASLAALLWLREDALRAPLPFLPKSGLAYAQALRQGIDDGKDVDETVAAALEKARKCWCGDDNNPGEAGPDARLALRGRDPFPDDSGSQDAAARVRFARIAGELFGAFLAERALDAEALR